ncbi:MAG: OmpA family protein [Alphaproteobacteria bacterium]|nr:OmpA family protein [Alphaproteobacteria bacterium]
MRFGLVVFAFVACGVASAQETAPAPSDAGITVNLDALPVATPKATPAADVRPLSLARPKPKPEVETSRVEGTLVVSQETAAVVAPAAPKPAPVVPTPPIATPPAEPAVPMTIVSSDTKAFPVEISGVARDPFAGTKTVNPLDGFAVMSRVRFLTGKTEITAQAQTLLDDLATRLLQSTVRIRLAAFSGRAGDLSSEARRLSLNRALAIRNYLSAKGVTPDRVDVLAFGGAAEGVTDRVDVLVRGT